MSHRTFTAVLLGAALALPAAAEDIALPQLSPAASVRQVIGVTEIQIDYHRPSVRGRAIWGALVPYDKVWRLGANEATTIRFGDPVRVAGSEVPAGTYALFAIPTASKWTLVLNKAAKQWGAFDYDAKQDQLRFEVTPQTAPDQEAMRITIDPTGADSGQVVLAWEKLSVAFPIQVEVEKNVWSHIDAALAGHPDDPRLNYRAAQYSLQTGVRRDEAWKYLAKVKAGPESFRNIELEADLLHRDGRTAEALPLLAKVKELAKKAGAPAEYFDELDEKAAAWAAEKK